MNLKYEVGQKVPVIHSIPSPAIEEIKGINIGRKGTKYCTASGAYTEAELDAFAAKRADKPFDWDAFRTEKIAVHCDTEEKATAFLKECGERGYKWHSGERASSNTHWCDWDVDYECYGCDETETIGVSPVKYFTERDYTIIDYPFSEQPTEPTEQKEPIKLYCVKDFESSIGQKFSVGTIYTLNSDGYLTTDNGSSHFKYKSADNLFETKPQLIGVLFPLVKRPAKVGEYVLLNRDDCFRRNKQGDVVEVVTVSGRNSFIKDPTEKFSSGIYAFFEDEYTYVLDGYQPEPEPEAEKETEYWNGKVVCVENKSFEDVWTVGKVYEFKDGFAVTDGGYMSPMDSNVPIKKFDDLKNIYSSNIKFIEFKGEQ